MRKQNSDFRAAFISEAGNQLKNNDYFGYVELDEYACYVIADGITDLPGTDSARLAIETVILYFQENPSLSKGCMRRLIREANKALVNQRSYRRQEASLTVVLTDYRRFRYGYLGNTRLRMYRGGRMFLQTRDMSLTRELADREQIPKDVLQEHEERNNLYSYLGQKRVKPFLSKKIKLLDTDILALYTRGIWENVDEGSLDDVFSQADNEVQGSLDNVEELLLSGQPENLENYTFAAVFINKVYSDPQRAKKRKKIIILSVVAAVVILLIIGLSLFLYHRRQRRIADMNRYFTNTVEYVNTGNFIRAKEECEKSAELADKLRDDAMRDRLQEYLFVIETVILGDESFEGREYSEAARYYRSASDRTRYADLIGADYMEEKLDRIADFLAVTDDISLGDSLLEKGNYEKAEEKYLAAKKLAATIHDTDGTEAAMAALEKLYAEWEQARKEQEEEADAQAKEEISAAELTAGGDRACLEQDFVGAKVFYTMALTKYQELGDAVNELYVSRKMETLEEKLAEQEEKRASAESLEQQAVQAQENGDPWGAKSLYLQAKNIYLELKSDTDVERLANLAARMDSLMGQQETP